MHKMYTNFRPKTSVFIRREGNEGKLTQQIDIQKKIQFFLAQNVLFYLTVAFLFLKMDPKWTPSSYEKGRMAQDPVSTRCQPEESH